MSSNTRLNSKKCDQCDYWTTFATTLKRHIRTHGGQKLNKCELCGHLFHQTGNLKRHMLIHNGEKPHKCRHCNYSCSETGDLKKHMRTHSGEKPYKCDQCDYASATASHLRRHKKTHKNPNVALSSEQSPQTPAYASKQESKKILQASIFPRTNSAHKQYQNWAYRNMYRNLTKEIRAWWVWEVLDEGVGVV